MFITCWRSKEEVLHKLLLWEPLHEKKPRGRLSCTFTDQLEDHAGIPFEEHQWNEREEFLFFFCFLLFLLASPERVV